MDVTGKHEGQPDPHATWESAGGSDRSAWDYLAIVHRRRWWLLVPLVCLIVLAALSERASQSVWSARAKVLIAPDQSIYGTSRDMSSFSPYAFAFGYGSQQNTQVAILESQRTVAAAAALLKTKPELIKALSSGEKRGLGPSDVRRLMGEFSFASHPRSEPAQELKEVMASLAVTPVDHTSIIHVTAAAPDARLAHDFVNAVCTVYLLSTLERTQRVASTALRYIRAQLQEAEERLADSEERVRAYSQESGVVAVETQIQTQLEAMTGIEARLLEAQSQEQALSAELADLKKQFAAERDDKVESVRTLVGNPIVTRLEQELVELKLQRQQLLGKYTAESSKVRAIEDQIASVEGEMTREVEQIVGSTTTIPNPIRAELGSKIAVTNAGLQAARAVISPLNRELARAKADLKDVPDGQIKLARLRRELELAEKHYLLLRNKEEEYVLAQEAQVGGAELLEPARLDDRRKMGVGLPTRLALGMVAGLCLGLLLVTIAETVDDTYPDLRSAEADLGLHIMGAIPRCRPRGQSPLLMGHEQDQALREAFLTLASNLRFTKPGGLPQSVAITSGQKGDGKSTVAANLALALAETGLKVLLIDGDMRQPSIHELFALEQTPGTSCALGGETHWAEAARVVEGDWSGELQVVPSGTCRRTPQMLLGSKVMEEILREAGTLSDVVVVDAPPLGDTSDAQILSSKTNATLVVFDMKRTRRPIARGAVTLLLRTGCTVLGAVANSAPRTRNPYYYT